MNNQSVSNQLYEIGKLQPQAVEMEEAVLGGLMLERDAMLIVSEMLSPRVFYKEAHGRIYHAIQNLFQRSEPIDILTVTNELKGMGFLERAGGAYYISQLTSRVATASNIEFHARILVQRYIQRELITICSQVVTEAYDPTCDVFDTFDRLRATDKLLENITSNGRKILSMSDLIQVERKNYEAMEKLVREGKVTGVPTGFVDMDRMTGGWQNSDLILLAARPGMGKTALLLALAIACALAGIPVLLFSLEMSALQLAQRLVLQLSGVDSLKYRRAKLDNIEKEIVENDARLVLEKLGIHIDDTPGIKVSYMRARTRRFVQEYGQCLVGVDYIQITEPEDRKVPREQQIGQISGDLKRMAKENNIPVIALSQLSRAVETRGGDKRPQLSDLRDSGSLEQDADMVLFIYRAEYYGFTQDADGQSTKGVAEIIFAKHRNGAVGEINLNFIPHLTKFTDPYAHEGVVTMIPPNHSFAEEGGGDHLPF